MSRRKRASLTPNLFPFLAVLVCTLGTLILLLALVAQKAEESAEQLVGQETEAARLIAEEERWEAEVLIEHRRKQTEELDKRRSELAHIEDHARRLREELGLLKQEIEATERQDEGRELKEAASRLVALREQATREKALITDLEKDRDGKPPRVIIVPYKGANGTDRRPIYVECTSTAVIIQPEGVRITASQLDGPMGPGNPLDAALRAVRAHWQTLDPNAPAPYPLLMVRPSGIHAYAASRIAMATWDDQFGYELIPEDLDLAFPVKDPALEIKLVEAVQVAIARNRARIASAPSKYNGFTPQRIASSQQGGGGVSDPNATAAAGERVGNVPSDGEAIRSGNGANFGPGMGSTGTMGTNSERAADPYAYGGNGEGRGSRDITIDGADLAAKRSGTASNVGNAGLGSSGTEYVSEEQFLGAAGTTSSGTGPQGGQTADEDDQMGDFGSSGTVASSGASGANGLGNPLEPGSGQAGGEMSSGRMSGGGAGSGAGNPAQAANAGMSAAALADPRQAENAFIMPEQFDPHEKTFSETMENRFAQSANRRAANGNSSDLPPALNASNNWALPDSVASNRGAAIVREMKLKCSAQGFVLLPETREQQSQAFPIQDGRIEQSVLELAKAIRQRVERWGVAMQNGRWEPVLSVSVAEGGETRYRQLEALLKNSGVRVEREVSK